MNKTNHLTSNYAFTFDSAVSSKILTSSDADDSSLVKIHWKNLIHKYSDINYNCNDTFKGPQWNHHLWHG